MWGQLILFSLFSFTDALLNENCSPKSCRSGMDSKKAACGSDGVSYVNRCHLELARCQQRNLTFVHRGNCRPDEQQTCAAHAIAVAILNSASSKSSATASDRYAPQCRTDGNFAAGQCHPQIGYCWCVTAQGFPIPLTVVPYRTGLKHKCGKIKKSTMRRSSANGAGQKKPAKACSLEDKALFNSNLIHIFTTEWMRNTEQPKSAATDAKVLEWKFDNMNLDKNEHLDRNEYKDLKRLVKKVVKPKRCAKSFAKACDMNRDQMITKHEWAQCLTRDGKDEKAGGEEAQNLDQDEEDEADEGEDIHLPPYRPSSILTDGSRNFNGGTNYDDDSSERRDEDETGCLSDRKTALGEGTQLYVPECTPDGRYAKVQCYKSAGYCFCVNEDTGKNIAGTAVKDQVPKCDQIVTVSRSMKGCPDDKKNAFLKDLMEYLHTSMIKETNGTTITGIGGSAWRSTKEEQVASWSFVFFDKNKNKVLDKAEWKSFKDTMSTVKNLKRCGKKLPRYCDINKDRHISMTEWLDCLNTNKYQEPL
ncbi:PREDICTED: SPARC-related modular calcium-binding protein 2 [Nicrophorus vespilloides]|uniref:SPARC-related modular calcium-binding protein 2 n=1 Tax=Nicrophorus vespilloides TaxID=110193 RepID=A0ABM1MTS6_NICVS|nr:PREDICTED: SPARC-related modular calcium-binding protein 2 [Nicrophorus vespilloides]